MTDKFPHPTNQWIEEDVEVPSYEPQVNEEEKRVEFNQKKQLMKQKTIYVDTKPVQVICGNHVFECVDKPKYLFKCTKCDWHKIAYPVTYRFDPETGFLTHRNGGQRV